MAEISPKRDALAAVVAAAWDRLCKAKNEMDYCRIAFEKAEDEWHQACVEHDRLEAEAEDDDWPSHGRVVR